jgi:hypothetical protein
VISASAVVVVGGVVIVLAATSSRTDPAAGERGGAFAAWNWSGHVTAVQASWNVPRIRAQSPRGVASTWIGAQGSGDVAPFIQIGVDEELRAVGTSGSAAFYTAWWSDTDRDDLPQDLFPVSPGDRIFASLILADGRWRLTLEDKTSPVASTSFSTRQETDGPFTTAEWTQEHIMGPEGHGYGYPRLSTIRFSDVAVDGAAPSPRGMYPQSMSLGGTRLMVPSSVSNDAFSIAQP